MTLTDNATCVMCGYLIDGNKVVRHLWHTGVIIGTILQHCIVSESHLVVVVDGGELLVCHLKYALGYIVDFVHLQIKSNFKTCLESIAEFSTSM